MMAVTEVTPVWIRDVMTCYQGDKKAGHKITALLHNSNSELDHHYLNGLLKYKAKIYIGSSGDIRKKLIATINSSEEWGHSGV